MRPTDICLCTLRSRRSPIPSGNETRPDQIGLPPPQTASAGSADTSPMAPRPTQNACCTLDNTCRCHSSSTPCYIPLTTQIYNRVINLSIQSFTKNHRGKNGGSRDLTRARSAGPGGIPPWGSGTGGSGQKVTEYILYDMIPNIGTCAIWLLGWVYYCGLSSTRLPCIHAYAGGVAL